jgi:N-acetylneuraminate synthase
VGYSSHERGWGVVVAAVALGASVVEKHITLDRTRPGVDHKIALLPNEFADMVRAIRQVERAMGNAGDRQLRHGERINRQALAKSLVARRRIGEGEIITRGSIAVRGPGRGIQPNRVRELLGRRARRPIAEGGFFFEEDLTAHSVAPRAYRFSRPWGIPVRYHDFADLTQRARPDFVEFHLSYKDLDQDPACFLAEAYALGFTVHCPDQFAEDHVFDLAADDPRLRQHSIRELQRVIDLARALTRFFPSTPRPFVIASLGGFSFDDCIAVARRRALYERIARSLADVDASGVELLPQTLPPFPWHFGGQRIGNLFTDADEIAWFCERFKLRLCLDVAHTYMAARHNGTSFEGYCERLAPLSAHLHLGDAAGVDGEGLQIGEGEIDFARLADCCDRLAPGRSFIPEIWEGHWNRGYGFWRALERLETSFGYGAARRHASQDVHCLPTRADRAESGAAGDHAAHP